MTETVTDRTTLVRTIAEQHRGERGALMPILHDVNDELGHIDREDIRAIADVLNLSVAEVHGVVSFYHDFRTAPRAAHTVQLCRAEACQSVGAQQLYDETVAAASGDELGDGVEVTQAFCFGNCALGPAGMVDGQLHGRLDGDRIRSLTEGWRA